MMPTDNTDWGKAWECGVEDRERIISQLNGHSRLFSNIENLICTALTIKENEDHELKARDKKDKLNKIIKSAENLLSHLDPDSVSLLLENIHDMRTIEKTRESIIHIQIAATRALKELSSKKGRQEDLAENYLIDELAKIWLKAHGEAPKHVQDRQDDGYIHPFYSFVELISKCAFFNIKPRRVKSRLEIINNNSNALK